MERKVYLDSASTTYTNAEVLQEMLPVFDTVYGNSNSTHTFGRSANELLDKARDRVAKAINAKPTEIYFTSGGTEANNMAIRGLAYANLDKGNHIITSKIEHPSILETCRELEKEGFIVTYLPVDKNGFVSLAKLMHHLTPNTILVSIMTANNEVGTIQHINAIAKTVKENGVLFHSDAVQAVGHLKLDVKALEVDALTISSHKLQGPKGAGALFVKKGVNIKPLIVGGSQEFHHRAGTVNVPAMVGFGKAIELATKYMNENNKKIKTIRDYFVKELKNNLEFVTVNANISQKVPHILSVTIDFASADAVATMLDMKGVAVSTGSACSAGEVKDSHVLKALGKSQEQLKSTLRFSFSTRNTKEEMDYTVKHLTEIVNKLREISPTTKKGKKGE